MARIQRNIPKSMSFRICVYPSQSDEGYFTAHCLELDLIGQDKNVEGAVSELLENIEIQLHICQETDAQLQFFAPPRVWQAYEKAKKAKRIIPDELMDHIIKQANKRLGNKKSFNVARRVDYIVGTKKVMDECQAILA